MAESSDDILVSVLVPVYNVEELLPRCLDSILAQTVSNFEVVCVDDASPDGSAKILERYAAADSRIRIVRHEHNRGLMVARRTGYLNARGKYLFFCDSDDYIPTDALEKLLAKATATDADIVVGQARKVNSEGRTFDVSRTGLEGTGGINYLRRILTGTLCTVWGSLYKTSLFSNGGFEAYEHQSFSEDRLLLVQLIISRKPSVATIPDVTYFYWINTQSITRKVLTREAVREQFTALFKAYDMVDASCPELRRLNNAFIIRYLSYYMEQVPWHREICGFNDTSRRLLTWKSLKANAGFLLRSHAFALLHIPGYRFAAWNGRKLIRRLQGKIG